MNYRYSLQWVSHAVFLPRQVVIFIKIDKTCYRVALVSYCYIIYKHITTVNSTTHHRNASCQVSVDHACFNIITLMISDRIFMNFSQGFENGLPKLTNWMKRLQFLHLDMKIQILLTTYNSYTTVKSMTFQGNSEIRSHRTSGRLIQV